MDREPYAFGVVSKNNSNGRGNYVAKMSHTHNQHGPSGCEVESVISVYPDVVMDHMRSNKNIKTTTRTIRSIVHSQGSMQLTYGH